ncbi:MAG: pyrimidine/purine nucleoside phosphorylase [Bacillota bacterium]|nr:pyrimidine/purine nucleoside phosphorylase [Bacillota bacterium]
MDNFNNVTAVKKANIYFDGKVTSRTIYLENGEKKTLGIMLPGEYEFGTADKELMEITQGNMEVLLPGSDKWMSIASGNSFEVPSNSKFKLIVKEVTDYCCSYIK